MQFRFAVFLRDVCRFEVTCLTVFLREVFFLEVFLLEVFLLEVFRLVVFFLEVRLREVSRFEPGSLNIKSPKFDFLTFSAALLIASDENSLIFAPPFGCGKGSTKT
jgi:hypothetical protein